MLSGDNSILQRTTDAKVKTEKAQIIEKAQTDILGQQAENKGTNITKGQLAEILNTYFKPTAETSIPDEISTTNDLVLTTIDEKYKINLSQIYTGSFEVEQAKWIYNHNTQTVTNGTLTLNIGDYINDTETTVEGFDGKWRVLGVEDRQLLLVTATCWAPFEGSTGSSTMPLLKLSGANGYINGISTLNTICATYADNIKTENGRSIVADDINNITGYNPKNIGKNDPNKTGVGIVHKSDDFQYGTTITYKMIDEKLNYSTDKGENYTPTTKSSFYPVLDSSNKISGELTCELTNNCYYYYGETLTNNSSEANNEGLNKNSPAYDMLFNVQGSPYWLATSCVMANKSLASWRLYIVASGQVNFSGGLWFSDTSYAAIPFGVRPVVSLKLNITPTFVSKDDTTNISTYEI